MLYDINGHAIKLYEAGKFYLNHRQDGYGQKLRSEHYETLKGWCTWIERHMSVEGLVLDITESNVWNRGYGTFTQTPSAAGIQLFINMATDQANTADVEHFTAVAARLTKLATVIRPIFLIRKCLIRAVTARSASAFPAILLAPITSCKIHRWDCWMHRTAGQEKPFAWP
jgi:hypothetical protein